MLLDRDYAAVSPEKGQTGELSDHWYLPDICMLCPFFFFKLLNI